MGGHDAEAPQQGGGVHAGARGLRRGLRAAAAAPARPRRRGVQHRQDPTRNRRAGRRL